MKKKLFAATVFALGLSLTTLAQAEETMGEKAEATVHKASDKMKKGARKMSDETCEMVNGKTQCTAKKLKHKVQNATDAVDTKVKEEKNKID